MEGTIMDDVARWIADALMLASAAAIALWTAGAIYFDVARVFFG